MNLSELFIRRPAMTTLLTVTSIVFGVLAYRALPVNDLPAVDYPVIQVQAAYPGASPDTMAANVATPLEKQFLQIPGLQLVTSKSSQGNTSLTLQFDLNKSIDAAATDVQSAITQASGSLPTDLPSPPTYSKTNPNDQPIQYIVMATDTVTRAALYDYANTEVQQRISILPGVSRVQVFGTKGAVRVKVDPSALAIRGLTVDDLATAIKAGTTYQGAGQLDGSNRTFLLAPQGQLADAAAYSKLIVAIKNNAPVYLSDVAKVTDSVQDERITMHFWARGVHVPKAVVVLAVFRQAGTNAVIIAKSVRDLLPLIQQQLPKSIFLQLVYDRSQSILTSAKDVQLTLVIAFALVVLVIYLFLGRAADTLIPVVALPLSLLMTFLVMQVLGYSLDNLSLMALTLAIGFLVDDAIVFLENCVSRLEIGESPLYAAIHSAKQISFTILSMTVSLAAVFLPLVFMPGLVGRIFHEFAITIIVAIFASGIVSLTLTPMMCSRMLARRGKGHKKTLMEKLNQRVTDRVLEAYGSSLTWFLEHRWISLVTWVITLAGTIWLFIEIPKGFLPIGDSSFAMGALVADQGASPQQMRSIQDRADAIMQANPSVNATFSVVGFSQFFDSNMAFLISWLNDPKERAPISAVCGQLAGALNTQIVGSVGGLRPQPVLQISTGATANLLGQYAYAISGINQQQVDMAAFGMLGAMSQFNYEGRKGFISIIPDLRIQAPSLRVDILRDQASTYGVTAQDVENTLRQAYSQNYVYLIKTQEDQFQVIMETLDKDRKNPADLSLLYVRSDDGQRLIPLSAVAKWTPVIGPLTVNHINQFASATIFFDLNEGVPIGAATNYIQNAANKIIPLGIRGELQGEAKDFNDTIPTLTLLMLMAVFVMYVILGILYESYVHPLTVLSSLPVALVGGLLTLYLFGEEASLYAFIGMFMLMGIVKKNGIMMIDFALQRLAQGAKSIDAIHEASMDRFRPIIMTTLAALMGALPIALGFGADGESRRPLGMVIVGGLIISQFITLYITPVIYLYMEEFQEKVLNRTSFFHSVPPVSSGGVAVVGHHVAGSTNGSVQASEEDKTIARDNEADVSILEREEAE